MSEAHDCLPAIMATALFCGAGLGLCAFLAFASMTDRLEKIERIQATLVQILAEGEDGD